MRQLASSAKSTVSANPLATNARGVNVESTALTVRTQGEGAVWQLRGGETDALQIAGDGL